MSSRTRTEYLVVDRGCVVGGHHGSLAEAIEAAERAVVDHGKGDHSHAKPTIEIEMHRTLSSGRRVFLRKTGSSWGPGCFTKIEHRRPAWPWLNSTPEEDA